jgi:chitin disaccharide deacetylase
MTQTLELLPAPLPAKKTARSPRRLIVNADGYGFTPGVNRGIVRTFEAGIVKSTSCTPNFGFLSGAGALARRFPDVSFGIHFNLSVGRPLTDPKDIPTLVDKDGTFIGPKLIYRICSGQVRFAEVVRELSAQAATLADQGIRISHWDGHQNKHLWPLYFEAGCEVAKHFGIRSIRCHRRLMYGHAGPISWRNAWRFYSNHPSHIIAHAGGRLRTLQAERRGFLSADSLISPGYTDLTSKVLRQFWETLARTLPESTHEIYCHPAELDDLLRTHASYVEERTDELELLTDPAILQLFLDAGIDLINFHEL